jgi:Transposase
MRKSRFTEEQIVAALQLVKSGADVGEVCRKVGVSRNTIRLEEEVRRSWCRRGETSEAVRRRESTTEEAGRRPVARQPDAERRALEKMVRPTERPQAVGHLRGRYEATISNSGVVQESSNPG